MAEVNDRSFCFFTAAMLVPIWMRLYTKLCKFDCVTLQTSNCIRNHFTTFNYLQQHFWKLCKELNLNVLIKIR